MADQTGPRPVNALGGIAGNLVLSPTLAPIGPGIAAATEIFSGEMVGLDSSGNMVSASAAAAVTVVGVARANFLNKTTSTPATSGLAGAISGTFLVGPYSCLGDGTVTASTPFGTDLFVVDNQTVSTSDAGATGTRLRAGYFVTLDTNSNPVVQFGVASPTGRAFAGAGGGFATPQNKARVVATSIGANTGTGTGQLTVTATGALGAQDGVTLVAGDVLFIQEGTTNVAAKDAGPWVVTVIGTTGVSPVLTRPDWYLHGGAIVPGTVIDVGGEGTVFLGTQWKTFAAKSKVIDTDAPVFWPGRMTQSVTLVTGFTTKTNMPIASLTTTGIEYTPTNFSGAASTVSYRTGVYASGGSATTAGVTGTASVSITALVAAGTFNTSDVGTGLLTVINW